MHLIIADLFAVRIYSSLKTSTPQLTIKTINDTINENNTNIKQQSRKASPANAVINQKQFYTQKNKK